MQVLWGSAEGLLANDGRTEDAFVTAETDAGVLQRLEKAQAQEEKLVADAELPLGLLILRWLGTMVLLVVVSGALKADVTLAQGRYALHGGRVRPD